MDVWSSYNHINIDISDIGMFGLSLVEANELYEKLGDVLKKPLRSDANEHRGR